MNEIQLISATACVVDMTTKLTIMKVHCNKLKFVRNLDSPSVNQERNVIHKQNNCPATMFLFSSIMQKNKKNLGTGRAKLLPLSLPSSLSSLLRKKLHSKRDGRKNKHSTL